MKKPVLNTIALFLGAAFIISCDASSPDATVDSPLNLPAQPLEYSVSLPAHFLNNDGGPLPTRITDHDNTPSFNPITNDGATLGRVLFWDTELSKNRTISCGSCHNPATAFSDSATFSKGFEGGSTRRHSMTLLFARYYQRGRFFWDERASSLEDQVLRPIQDEVEMGLTEAELVERVKLASYYPDLFKKAFGDETVSKDRIAMALAQFVRSMVSSGSKYDAGRAASPNMGANFPNFTAQENQGKQLFLRPVANGGGGCFGCHTTEAFINVAAGATNNGLDEESVDDLGVFETFPQPRQLGAFKTTSLRNIAQGAPYMHDGRFKTLREVVQHYNTGIKNHPNLAPALRDPLGNPVRLNFTESQVDALVAFLETLTDESVATQEKWSNPFRMQ
jgi:cytochrome c peroxidase